MVDLEFRCNLNIFNSQKHQLIRMLDTDVEHYCFKIGIQII